MEMLGRPVKSLTVYCMPDIPCLVPGMLWLVQQMQGNLEQVDQTSGSVSYMMDL